MCAPEVPRLPLRDGRYLLDKTQGGHRPRGPELSHKFFEVVLGAFKAPKVPEVLFFEDKAQESGSGSRVCFAGTSSKQPVVVTELRF